MQTQIVFPGTTLPNKTIDASSTYAIYPNDSISSTRQKIYFALIDQKAIAPSTPFDHMYLCTRVAKPLFLELVYQELLHAYTDRSIPFAASLTQLIYNRTDDDAERASFQTRIATLPPFPNRGEVEHLLQYFLQSPPLTWTPIGFFPPMEMPYLYAGNPKNWIPDWAERYQKREKWFLTQWDRYERQLLHSYIESMDVAQIYVFFRPDTANDNSALVLNHWPTYFIQDQLAEKHAHLKEYSALLQNIQEWGTQLKAAPLPQHSGYLSFSTALCDFRMPKYFSLAMLFENIHATAKIPIIKHAVHDRPFRLYSSAHDEQTNPVPDIDPADIMDWSNQWTAFNHLYLYVAAASTSAKMYYTVVITPKGQMMVHLPQYKNTHLEQQAVTAIEDWLPIIRDDIFPALQDILQYIQSTGMPTIVYHTHPQIRDIQYKEEYAVSSERTVQTVREVLGRRLASLFQLSHVSPPKSSKHVIHQSTATPILMKRVAFYDFLWALQHFYSQTKELFPQLVGTNFEKVTQSDLERLAAYKPTDPNSSIGMRITLLFPSVNQVHIVYHSAQTPVELLFARQYMRALLHLLEMPAADFGKIPRGAAAGPALQIGQLKLGAIRDIDKETGENSNDGVNSNDEDGEGDGGDGEGELEESNSELEESDSELEESESEESESADKKAAPIAADLNVVNEIEAVKELGDSNIEESESESEESEFESEESESESEFESEEPIPILPTPNPILIEKEKEKESAAPVPTVPVAITETVAPTVPEDIEEVEEVADEEVDDGFVFSFGSDGDDDSDVDGAGAGKISGAGKKVPEKVDADVILIKGKNSAMNEKRRLDAELYANESIKNNNYSQKCQSNINAQPVMLTQDEFERQDPTTYDEFIKYGSSKKNEHYYICPRFWCFKKNKALTYEQVMRGECANGGKPDTIIPPSAEMTRVSDGHVYEFTSQTRLDANGNYIPQNPIFQEMKTAAGEDKGVPCCGATEYSNWDKYYDNRPDEYYRYPEKFKQFMRTKNKDRGGAFLYKYIIHHDKVVPDKRMGYIPPTLETMFRTKTSTDQPFLIRHGVETSGTASFIGAMADIYAHVHKKEVPSITQFVAHLSDVITLDDFTKYNHGRLVAIFTDPTAPLTLDQTDAEAQSRFVRESVPNMRSYIPTMIQAYRNFIAYLRIPAGERKAPVSSAILRDILCTPHPKIIPSGLNVVIVEEAESGENTIQLFVHCPKYSSFPLYDAKKPTWMVLKRQSVYEPVYLYTPRTKSTQTVTRLFHLNPPAFIESFLSQLNELACASALLSTASGLAADEMYDRLSDTPDLSIAQTFRNTHGLTAGFLITDQKKKEKQVVYCRGAQLQSPPSLPSDSIENAPLFPYDKVLAFLQTWSDTLQCAPKATVVSSHEEKTAIGILTTTHIFYPVIHQPVSQIQENGLSIHVSHVRDPVAAQESALAPAPVSNTANAFQMDTYFYQLFQKRMRAGISDSRVFGQKQKILDILKTPPTSLTFSQKRGQIRPLLKSIGQFLFEFAHIPEYTWAAIDMEDTGGNCSGVLCANGKWILPKRPLHASTSDNSEVYYGRLADELVRNLRMRNYILKTDEYIYMYQTGVQLRTNEMLVYLADIKSLPKRHMVYNVDGVRNVIAL